MKIIHQEQVIKINNSKHCLVSEYSLGDKDINGALVELSGRYPDKDRAVNSACKELAYIISGSGKAVIDSQEFYLGAGDLVLIEPGEKFFWQGKMAMFISCTPAWHYNQYKEVE